MNVHAATGTAIVKLPSFKLPGVKRVSGFVLGGGGAMFFAPRAGSLSEQTRGAFVYGGGVDVPVSRHFLVRAQYRGFVYKTPDFEMAILKVDKYTHAAVPLWAWYLCFSTVSFVQHFKAAGTSRLSLTDQ